MDSPVRRRTLSVLVVVLAMVLVPVGAAWAFWVVNAPTQSSVGGAATVPVVTGLGCSENGDEGVRLGWTAATPTAPSAYGYTISLTQTGPAWTGSIPAGTATSSTLAPGNLSGAHNGAVVATVTTRYPATGGAGWTSVASTSTTFYMTTKYFLWIFPYTALDCVP